MHVRLCHAVLEVKVICPREGQALRVQCMGLPLCQLFGELSANKDHTRTFLLRCLLVF